MAVVYIPSWLLTWITVKQGSERYHFNYSYKNTIGSTPTDAQLLQMATEIYNFAATGLAPILATNCVVESCTIRNMNDASGHEQVYAPASPGNGASTGDPEPANIAGVLSYNPTAVGKGVKGRTYISGFSDTTIVGQVISSALASALTALASAYRTYHGPSGFVCDAVIASRKHILLRNIVSSVVSTQVNNQIRRLIGHRRHKRHTSP